MTRSTDQKKPRVATAFHAAVDAASGETDAMLKKLAWLKQWLRHSPRLDALHKIFVWQLSNVERNPNDRRRRTREAEKHGLRRVEGRLRLADHA